MQAPLCRTASRSCGLCFTSWMLGSSPAVNTLSPSTLSTAQTRYTVLVLSPRLDALNSKELLTCLSTVLPQHFSSWVAHEVTPILICCHLQMWLDVYITIPAFSTPCIQASCAVIAQRWQHAFHAEQHLAFEQLCCLVVLGRHRRNAPSLAALAHAWRSNAHLSLDVVVDRNAVLKLSSQNNAYSEVLHLVTMRLVPDNSVLQTRALLCTWATCICFQRWGGSGYNRNRVVLCCVWTLQVNYI